MGKIGKTKTKSKPNQPEQQLKYVGPRDLRSARRNLSFALVACAGAFILDLVACFLLFGSIHWWWGPPAGGKPIHWSIQGLWPLLADFYHDTLDILLITILRVVLLNALAWVAARYAFAEGWEMECKGLKGPKGDASKDPSKSTQTSARLSLLNSANSTAVHGQKRPNGPFHWMVPNGGVDLRTPLLSQAGAPQQNGGAVEEHAHSAHSHGHHNEGGHADENDPEGGKRHHEEDEEEDEKHRVITPDREEPDPGFSDWFGTVSAKDTTLFLSFLLCTVFQVYVGAKCVSFFFTKEALQGFLMGSAVIWINLESSSLSNLAESSGVLGRACALAAKKATSASLDHDTAEAASLAASAAASAAAGTGPAGTPLGGPPAGAGGAGALPSAGGRPPKGVVSSSAVSGAGAGGGSLPMAAAEDVLRGDKGVREEALVSPRSYLMRAIALAYDELPLLSFGFLCLAVTSAAGLIIPNYQGRILDDVIKMDTSRFRRDVTFMAVFSLVTGIFGGLRGLCFSVVGKRILKTLQDKLFSGVIIQDIAYFDSTTSGELTSRLTNDVAAMSEPINWQLSALVRNLAQLAGGIVLCFWTSWKLSMLAFTTMQPIMHITSIYSRWSRELNRTRYAVLAEANSAASEAFSNIRTVRAYSTENVEVARYQSKTRAAMLKGVRDAVAYSGAVAINNWLDLGASVLILWYGGYLVMAGRLSIGQLITFQLYWNLIQNGYQSVMSVLTSLTKASGAAQRVLSLVDALPDIDPNSGTIVSTLNGAVAFNDVHFHYQMRPDNPVLQGVSLSIKPGQVCALVGRSGGGKSTLVHLLMRYYDPVTGSVSLDGQDLCSLNLKSVHACMGLVAQDTQMWATSIEENIAYGLPHYTRAQVEEAARFANAHKFIIEFPEGYATRVGERGVRLSGGQRQRIAIARMLLRKPRLLVLDEATSALDTESEALVQEALDRLIAEGGRTIILVAHRLSTVRNADIIGVIDNGKIVEQGTHESLVRINNGVYEKLVRRQLSKSRNTIGGITIPDAAPNDKIDHLLEQDT